MAVRIATVLKTFFETGDFPTQAQFGDLIDSTDNHLITGDVTIDLNNVATVNPTITGGVNLFSTTVTRTAVQGSGTVTITTPFRPKLAYTTTIFTSIGDTSTGSLGRSNGTNNSCKYTLNITTFVPITSQSFCIAAFDNTAPNGQNGFSGIINNFTATSFDIVYTKVNSGGDITVQIDVIG